MSRAGKKTLLVFGGNGYVGSHICEQGILNGFNVISISRTGKPPAWLKNTDGNLWHNQVQWFTGNALINKSFEHYLTDVTGIVSCVGGFHYKQSEMHRMCGDTNVNICRAAKAHGVDRFVFISAAPIVWKYNPMNWWLSGYHSGKMTAEKCVKEEYNGNGVSLRCGMITGTRYMLGGRIGLPLYFMGWYPSWLVSTVHADDVAKASVRFVQSQDLATADNVVNDDIKNFMFEGQGDNSKSE